MTDNEDALRLKAHGRRDTRPPRWDISFLIFCKAICKAQRQPQKEERWLEPNSTAMPYCIC